ncbi:pyrimidine-nucleoside phosphorylase [Caloranaerobacter azorensis]|uniref:Pyrimidine-nucleoside phosphorylase n=1 Tax=Caloranaerobacter azorensis TaxID=116090 RepID=A0A6P1Y9K6_9FIRM|nr:pyrimidine-nucleoside phosphorylase [Caloranaerobacter azorensis]QIB26030.1 pyrimidine-nucleoside phosphorylase [Caloranaerobacter azorensis]
MRMYDIIKKKRDGFELTKEEIEFFVEGYTKGDIPDYQISALLMAIFLNKMTKRETVDLTKAMLDSGDKIDLSNIEGIKVDKHSTGGVGDKTTLVLGPMVAACGLPVAKMSGRGLGHTGGTLDKLESIKGLRIELSKEEFAKNVNNINIAVCGQTGDIAPADKKLYALRDVTATVDNISLIASSIMSKKLAVGSDGIVLDVKVGSGAFMKDFDNAYKLAEEMVDIGNSMGRKTVAVISNMDEPLGYAVGNALEVKEAIETLRNNGPEDLVELCLTLGSHMLVIGNKAKDLDEAREKLVDVLESGKAYEKFIEFVEAQGGDVNYVKDTSLLPQAEYVLEVKSDEDGYVQSMNAEEVGKCALFLGAGRETKESEIDLSAGIVLAKKVDDKVSKGEILAYVHSNDKEKGEEIVRRLKDIIKIGDKNKDEKKLIFTIVKKNS